ncbi:MAG TPA: site-2 protease family protein [Patescibacteria group bacterium]|nr:site-2 protease family protein [Patescibacteria group bacterium]
MIFSLIQQQPLAAIVFLLAIVMAISVHEFSHALAGFLQGDNTAKYDGRLTLNPLAHLDMTGSIMLLLVGFGWGKPVPYNPYNLKYKKWGPVFVGLAGPVANLITFLLAGILYNILTFFLDLGPSNLLIVFLFYLGIINVGLMLFNLLPLPPLDGSKLLDALLPDRYSDFKENLFRYGPYILLSLLVLDIVLNVPVFGWLGNIMEAIFFLLF